MQFKKISIIIIAVLMIASVIIPGVFADAETAEPALELAVATNVAPANESGLISVLDEDTFNVTFSIDKNVDGLKGLGFEIAYDSEYFALIGENPDGSVTVGAPAPILSGGLSPETIGEVLGISGLTAVRKTGDGKIRFDLAIGVTEYQYYVGDLFTLTFKVLKNAEGEPFVLHKASSVSIENVKARSKATNKNIDNVDVANLTVYGHDFTDVQIVDPDCENIGYSFVECTDCDFRYEFAQVAALGHNYGELIAEVPPTCVDTGVAAHYNCDRCGKIFNENYEEVNDLVIPALGHSFDIVVTDPTCVGIGYTTKTCTVCGYAETYDEVEALGHTYVVTGEMYPAECTAEGYVTYTCLVCGDSYNESTPARGHVEFIDVEVAPTCTVAGRTEGKHCLVCGEILVAQTEIPALGHDEAIDAAVAPSCTETGLTEGKHCKRCGEILVAQTVVAALGHKEVVDPAVEATAFEDGLTEGKHCSVCNTILEKQEVIPAKGITSEWWFWVIIAVVVIAVVSIILVVVAKKKKAGKEA